MHKNKFNISGSQALTIAPRSTNKVEQILNWLSLNKFYSKTKKVAVLHLDGMIGKSVGLKNGLTFDSINELIEKSFTMSRVVAVCLVINSPGGSPVQTELIAKRIRALSLKYKLPVYSFVEDIAASGGYWLACAGGEIYASKSSIIGSIGVITSGFGFEEAIKKLGIERRVITSGQNKSVLDPFKPLKEEDITIILNMQKQVHAHFIEYIKASRKNKLTQSDDVLFNGEFWAGETALDYGLIDGIDNLYDFVERKFGDNIKVEHITTKKSWLKNKLGLMIDLPINNLVNRLFEEVYNKINHNKFDLR